MEDKVREALELFKRDKDQWQEIYDKAAEDLRFQSDDDYAQWDEVDHKARINTNRPALTFDQMGQFVHQVANDIRQNTPTFTVIPDDGESSEEDAEAFRAIIRGIEYKSNADDVYDTAALNAVKCSIGYIRLDHDYTSNEGFEQELLIKRVVNPLSVYLDGDSIECDGRDAKHGLVLEKRKVSEFKKRWPEKEAVSFEGEGKHCKDDKEDIYTAEFFQIQDEEQEITLDGTGKVVPFLKGMPDNIPRRKVKKSKVKRYTLSGADILEETWFPGIYVPLIPVYGEEHWIEGKRELHSLIRKAKPAQKMYNLWRSLETEILMKQPLAPVMAAEGSIEDYKDDWENPQKAFALRYKTEIDGKPLPPPQRLEPPTLPSGMINAAREAVEDIKSSMGLYNASVGQRGSATSGKQEIAQQQEGDVATFHFYDNLVRSVTHVYRILICAIPEIYDTPRILRAVGKEEEPQQIGVNGDLAPEQEKTVDLTKGKYTVRVVPGASYTTKRQEAAAFFTEIVTKQPELMNVMGDLLFKYSDIAGADAMAERMKKVIDPKFLQEDDNDPTVTALQAQIQEATQVIQQLQGELATKDTESKMQKTLSDIKAQKTDLKLSEQLTILKIELEKKDLQLAQLQIEKQFSDDLEAEEEAMQAEQLPQGNTSYNSVGVS